MFTSALKVTCQTADGPESDYNWVCFPHWRNDPRSVFENPLSYTVRIGSPVSVQRAVTIVDSLYVPVADETGWISAREARELVAVRLGVPIDDPSVGGSIFALARTGQLSARAAKLTVSSIPDVAPREGVVVLPAMIIHECLATGVSTSFWVPFSLGAMAQATCPVTTNWLCSHFASQSRLGPSLMILDTFDVEFKEAELPGAGRLSDEFVPLCPAASKRLGKAGRPPLPEARAIAGLALKLARLPADHPHRNQPKRAAAMLESIYVELGVPNVGSRRLIEGARAAIISLKQQEM